DLKDTELKNQMTEEELQRVFDGELSFEEHIQKNEEKTYFPSYDLSPNFAEEVGSAMEEYEVPMYEAVNRIATSKLEIVLKDTSISINDFTDEQLEQIMSAITEYDFYQNEIAEIADPKLPTWKMEQLKLLIDDWNHDKVGVTSEKIKYLKDLDIDLAKFNVLKSYLINDEVSISQIEEFKENIDFITINEFVEGLNDYAYNNQTEKVAIKVGNEFILATKQDSFSVQLEDTGRKVVIDGKEYQLQKGATFNESTKIDDFIDSGKYESFKIADYIKEEKEQTLFDFMDDTTPSNESRLANKYHVGDKVSYKGKDYVISRFDEMGNNIKTVTIKDDVGYLGGMITGSETILYETESDLEKLFEPIESEKAKVSNYKISEEILADKLTPSERLQNNIEAILMLNHIEKGERKLDVSAQEVLAKYVGWGGLADVFDESKGGQWLEARNILKENLSPLEYEAAKESTLTAFYTPKTVIDSVYKTLSDMGFKKGNILEPSMGIGNFIGNLPDEMNQSKFYGVELDSVSGRIGKLLYPNSNIQIKGFEETSFSNNFFDVAIGNVPFGEFKVNDRDYNKNNFLIHDYFFAKSIDKVRNGGVIAFITSSGTMDKKDESIRKYLNARAEFLGAIRLPNDTFKGMAGTEVTSDIIFLKKRDSVIERDDEWVHLAEDENGLVYNKYFVDHHDMVLGQMEEVSGRFGNTI
ncbi:MAG: Eco57I restriction-modification methylase domain-containing protein, partial [Coprobacillus cateniformis]